MRYATSTVSLATLAITFALPAVASAQAGNQPALTLPRITQNLITSGALPLTTIRAHGLRMFATPFNKEDGYGDGLVNPANTTSPGGRPTLQNNGTFLRVNGLDAQTCMECHSILSADEIPFRFGIGGIGGSNNNVLAAPTNIDPADTQGNGFAAFNGRYINPPFLLGSGGVELVAREMTTKLQELAKQAEGNPGTTVPLNVFGVDFGSVSYSNGSLDTSLVIGVEHDLVVRPFGRKGEFATARAFDIEAVQFHFGMQPVEIVGQDVDADLDGVINEVLVGELSALHIFDTNLEKPIQQPSPDSIEGRAVFESLGCAECHVPSFTTSSSRLNYSFPVDEQDPSANIYYSSDLASSPAGFKRRGRGIEVDMFSDLKRHNMGPGLAESTGGHLDPFFITARLWGIADTAPYLHDGRALTLSDAILAHGGEAQRARDAFAGSGDYKQDLLIKFLKSLRTPTDVATDLDLSSLR